MSRVVKVKVGRDVHNVWIGDEEPDENAVATLAQAWPHVNVAKAEIVEEES